MRSVLLTDLRVAVEQERSRLTRNAGKVVAFATRTNDIQLLKDSMRRASGPLGSSRKRLPGRQAVVQFPAGGP
jgi:hypothetical protein